MRLPRALLRHRVKLSPLLGSDATGPIHGPRQDRRAYVEAVGRANTGAEGRTTSATTAVWIDLDRDVDAEWRVEVDDRVRDVVEVRHYDGGGLATPDHTQILVK